MGQSLNLYFQNQPIVQNITYIKIGSGEVQITDPQPLTEFAGASYNIGVLYPMSLDLLRTAVNNRTRERNYFRLLSQYLSEEISADDFDREIEENEDLYVLNCSRRPSRAQFEMACFLSNGLLGVDSPDDFFSLFSFSEEKTFKLLNDGKE